MKLSLAKLQKPLKIMAVEGEPETVARLRELGILLDTEIELIRRTPLAGPLVLKVGTAFVVVRTLDASRIEVEEIA